MKENKDYDAEWNLFWENIITNLDGSINLEQLKKELYNYSIVMHEVSKVYEYITNGKISKPNTNSEDVISISDDEYGKMNYNFYRDDILDILKDKRLSAEYKIEAINDYFSEEWE